MGIKFYDSNGKYWGEYDETRSLFIPAETQNSNLTFEKRTMRDCYNCKRYETEGECIECHYEPKDECAKEYEELGLKELKELIEADCDTCRNKGVEGCEQPCLGCGCCGLYEPKDEPTISKMEQVDEPQKDCKKCKNYDRCKNNRWKCCVYQPKDEPQTDIKCSKCKHNNERGIWCHGLCKYEPQTDCAWK